MVTYIKLPSGWTPYISGACEHTDFKKAALKCEYMIGVSVKSFVHSLGVSLGMVVTWVCKNINVSGGMSGCEYI